jgi:hypothetical protein
MDKRMKVSALSFIIVVGFTAAAGYHYYRGMYLGRPYPENTFLFLPSVHFSDFYDVVRDGHTLDPYLEYSSAQYPFLALLGYLFSLIPRYHYAVFAATVCGVLFFGAVHLWVDNWHMSATHVFVIALLSYPFLIAVDRGNFELLVFILLLAFLFFFTRKRYWASALCLSLAISMKLYPAILLVLFVPERKYREMAATIASAAAVTLASLACFNGGIGPNLTFLLRGANLGSNPLFAQFTSLSSPMVQRGVSLLTFIKIVSIETGVFQGLDDGRFLSWYFVSAGLVGVLVVLYVVFVEKEAWKRTALLVFAMLLLPHISADYKLLHLYLALYLFVNCRTHSKSDAMFLLMFGLLLIPKDYGYLSHVISDAAGVNDISLAVPANIIVIVLMSLMIVSAGLAKRVQDPRKKSATIEVQSPG